MMAVANHDRIILLVLATEKIRLTQRLGIAGSIWMNGANFTEVAMPTRFQ